MITLFERRLLDAPITTWRVNQIVALDWYDGPREGICELAHPRCCLYFQLKAEQWLDGKFGTRLFCLSELPNDAMARTLAAFGVEEAPNRPVWAPHGEPDDSSDVARLSRELDEILAAAIGTRLLARSADMVNVEDLWIAVPEPPLTKAPKS